MECDLDTLCQVVREPITTRCRETASRDRWLAKRKLPRVRVVRGKVPRTARLCLPSPAWAESSELNTAPVRPPALSAPATERRRIPAPPDDGATDTRRATD